MPNTEIVHEETLVNRGLRDIDILELKLSMFTYGIDDTVSATCSIFINGKELKHIIRDCPDIKDGGYYADIRVDELYDSIKEPTDDIGESVYGCGCGVIDCNPLYVRIRENDKHVVWDRFDPDITTEEGKPYWVLGAFVFDKDQYYNQVEKLKQWTNELYKYYAFCSALLSDNEQEIQEYLTNQITPDAVYTTFCLDCYYCEESLIEDFDIAQIWASKLLHVVPLNVVIKKAYQFLQEDYSFVILDTYDGYKDIKSVYFLKFDGTGLLKRVHLSNDFSIFDFKKFKEELSDKRTSRSVNYEGK